MAGIYQLSSGKINRTTGRFQEIKKRPFTVVPDVRESVEMDSLSAQEINDRLGFRPIHATAGTDPGSYLSTDRTNQEWTLWLLLAALVLLFRETFIAFMCSQPGAQWNPMWIAALVFEVLVLLSFISFAVVYWFF
jgi:hypothetical protein